MVKKRVDWSSLALNQRSRSARGVDGMVELYEFLRKLAHTDKRICAVTDTVTRPEAQPPRNRVRVSEKQAGGGGVSCLLNTPTTTTSWRVGYRTNNNSTERRKHLVPYCICIILIVLIGYLQFDLTGRTAVTRTTK
jgi:hypothetical protein